MLERTVSVIVSFEMNGLSNLHRYYRSFHELNSSVDAQAPHAILDSLIHMQFLVFAHLLSGPRVSHNLTPAESRIRYFDRVLWTASLSQNYSRRALHVVFPRISGTITVIHRCSPMHDG